MVGCLKRRKKKRNEGRFSLRKIGRIGLFSRKYLVSLVLLILPFQLIHAQQSNTFYFMHSVPQTSDMNPAFSVPCNYIGLPVISSFHLDVGNTGFSYNQIFPVSGDGRMIDFNYLEKGLHNLDLLNARLQFDLFSLGMWYDDYFLTFSITEKADLFTSYPKNLFLVPWEGNTAYVGETAKIRRFGGDFSHYREYSLSASTWLNSDLRLGVRAGLLFGRTNLSTRGEILDIYTRQDSHHLDISGSYTVNSTIPLQLTKDAGGNITDVQLKEDIPVRKMLLNGRNPGLNFDLGGIYTGLEDLILYGGLNDIGVIYWTSELNNLEAEQQFRFNGFTREDLRNEDYAELMLDSLENSYDTTITHEPYLTLLSMESYIGATYQINDRFRARLLQRNLFYKWRIYPSLTLSLNTELGDFLSVSASYSYNRYSFSNFGAGFSIQNNNVQFYMVTDNLRAINPLAVRNVNLRFGFNVFFGCGGQAGRAPAGTGISGAGCYWIRKQQENEKILPKK